MDRKVFLAARVRPMTDHEMHLHGMSCIVIDQEGSCVTLVNPENGDAKAYVLDYVYDSTNPPEALKTKKPSTADSDTKSRASDSEAFQYAGNDALYKDVGVMLLQEALEGYNVCLFVYGHGRSGRSHTMVGVEPDPGVLPRMMEGLFQSEKVMSGELAVEVSFFEVQNEQLRDILRRDPMNTGNIKVLSRGEGKGSVVEGLTRARLKSMEDCEDFLANVLSCMALISQSAHSIVTMALSRVEVREGGGGSGREVLVPHAKINLVELSNVGSLDSGAGKTLNLKAELNKKEPQDKSLLAWGSVMSALAERQARSVPGVASKVYVPFRQSILTRILEDSMGHRSRTAVVITLSPCHLSFRETVNTFRTVARTKEVQRVTRDDSILNPYADTTFIPAAGGGWRWSYCVRTTQAE